MRFRAKISYAIMLLAAFWVLLVTCIPHHHHSDGIPCFDWSRNLQTEAHHHAHGCDMKTGNHIPFNNISIKEKRLSDDKQNLPTFQLLSIFNYTDTFLFEADPNELDLLYVESLHAIWISKGSGLRAPPSA